MYEYTAKLLKVVDGDTFDFELDLGLKTYRRERIRLAIYDAYECYGRNATQKGAEAKDFAENQLRNSPFIILKTIKDKQGKYGRYLAEVYYYEEGRLKNFGEELYNIGLAKIYGK